MIGDSQSMIGGREKERRAGRGGQRESVCAEGAEDEIRKGQI